MKLKFLLLVLVLVSCATENVQVVRLEGGSFKVIVTATDKQEAEEIGYSKAQEYCSKNGKEAIISSSSARYKGTMNETTRTTMRTASKVGVVVAAGALAKGENRAAETVGSAAAGGLFSTSDRDYEGIIIFSCDDQLLDKPGSPDSNRLW